MADERIIRIGSGSGSWGNDITEPRELLSRTHVNYLVMDYLAELTLSIMRRQMDRNPEAGFATDFLAVLEDILPLIAKSGTKIVTNAGGLNPRTCGRMVAELVEKAGLSSRIKVAIVDGDDLLPRLSEFSSALPFDNADDGRPFSEVARRIVSANAYFGAQPIREALDGDASIVIAGRCVDVALTLGPLIHEFGWGEQEWDRLAAGTVAGHLLECGPQATGGNHQGWQDIPGLEHVGYPIAEVSENGDVVLTKASGTGGAVNRRTVTDQLLHEVFDPRHFLSPDVTVDWTTIELNELGDDRVRLSGIKGTPPPSTLKVSMTYRDGYKAILMWPYAWPDAEKKAQAAFRKIEHTIKRHGLRFDETRADIFGAGAIHGRRSNVLPRAAEPLEVIARFAAHTEHKEDAGRLASQQAPMHYGPPGLAGQIAGGKGQVLSVYSHWPTLIPGDLLTPTVEFMGGQDCHG
ncbi:acyclic terpene utilization AtuA family protein [Propylenella binzhouense]|uniref:DUF1446 domain-containing protein n=1 Tax=Propylenella binzhouense TaxID=2555902 RepID=A0A964T1R2_9HYPH|nr:acyclic terpene utilization AtuA family protein [Propylenella binzhouense]MYZ46853.1 DUF1446 domain-containing protein [Propylenella binzhouense]